MQQRDDPRVGPGPHPHESPAVPDRGTGELLGVVRLAREVGRLQKRDFAASVSPARLWRVTAREQQVGALDVVRCTARSLKRHREETSAFLERELLHRSLAGEPRVPHRAIDRTDGKARAAVPRELGESRPEVAAAQHLERATGFIVETPSPQGGDLLVERFGHDGMAEPEMPRSSGAVDDDRDRRRFVERRGDIDIVTRQGVQDVEREVAAEHRRELEHVLARVRELAEATQHGLSHVAWDRQSIRLGCVVEMSFGREEARHFTRVQRIAFGQLADACNQPR